jgi:hypothetical protein
LNLLDCIVAEGRCKARRCKDWMPRGRGRQLALSHAMREGASTSSSPDGSPSHASLRAASRWWRKVSAAACSRPADLASYGKVEKPGDRTPGRVWLLDLEKSTIRQRVQTLLPRAGEPLVWG